MTFGEALLQGSKAAMCGYLANGGNLAATNFIVAGAMTPGGQLPAAAGALGLLALNYGCTYDPNGGDTGWQPDSRCLEVDGSGGLYSAYIGTDSKNFKGGGVRSILEVKVGAGGVGSTARCLLTNGTEYVFDQGAWPVADTYWYLMPDAGSTCIRQGPPGTLPPPPPPYQYTDPVTNCVYNFELEAFEMDAAGNASPVWKVSPGGASALASGGVIGGCTFPPVIYKGPGGGGGGGGPIIPWNPGPDGPGGLPWWVDLLNEIGAELTAAAIRKIFESLFTQKLPGVTYRLVSVCEVDAEGESISQAVEHVIPELPTFEALDARLGALVDIAQGLKNFKQPICETVIPEYTGRAINVRFRSMEPSPASGDPLRKDFSYRDPSDKDLILHRDHWKDFTWKSGPWMVISKGAVWGQPRVWAETADEGKRVLRHAAAIAGVDLTGGRHRFVAREITNGRYGPELTMRVRRDKDGDPWVTERSGPSGPPSLSIDLPATLMSRVDNGSQQS